MDAAVKGGLGRVVVVVGRVMAGWLGPGDQRDGNDDTSL